MHAVCGSPRRVSERAESRLFYVTVSEKRAGVGGLEMCDETEGGEGGVGRWGRREIEEEREKRN